MKKVMIASIAIVLLLSIGLVMNKSKPAQQAYGTELPKVGSLDNFLKLVEEVSKKQTRFYETIEETAMEFGRAGIQKESMALDLGSDHSSTNVQVAGVDEADRIKNDGKFIYQLRDDELVISQVNPVNEMKIVYSERFDYNHYYPFEMYVDDKHLVLIGRKNNYEMNKVYHKDFTTIKIYQLNDRSNLTLIREAEVEGYYQSSRKINDSLYVVTNKHLPYFLLNETREKGDKEQLLEDMKPTFRDSIVSDEPQVIDWEDIYYFPGSLEENYLIVTGLDLAKTTEPMNVQSFLGAGSTIYASHENLYVTRTDFQYDESPIEKITTRIFQPPTNQDTIIYKFGIDRGRVTFLAEGKVEGALLNQFSMDEYNGHFRIATTKGDMWSDTNPSENLLFVLDEKLETVGSITGIAEGERIFSVRFMGDRGYIVTFKQVDPLFVLDLKDPTNPTILGELKIPGFSDYLHPYDENHIIGFGKDTEEIENRAMVRGFKMALFDITDVTNPKEKFVEIIGDQGTHSELLYNHKALLFSKSKNIIGFPIDVYERKGTDQSMYSEISFQGAYIYGLDLEEGFERKSRISHYEEPVSEKSWDYQKHITRLVYIGDNLYTLSNDRIEAHDLISFEKKGQIKFGK